MNMAVVVYIIMSILVIVVIMTTMTSLHQNYAKRVVEQIMTPLVTLASGIKVTPNHVDTLMTKTSKL